MGGSAPHCAGADGMTHLERLLGDRRPRLRALRQDPAEVAVDRPDLDAPGVIRPGPAALRAGGGQLLIPPDPAIAAIGKVSHITRLIQAGPLRTS